MAVNPFSKEALPKINKLIAACMETRAYLAKCKLCGLDVDKEVHENEDQMKVVQGIKEQFFGKKP